MRLSDLKKQIEEMQQKYGDLEVLRFKENTIVDAVKLVYVTFANKAIIE